MSEYQYTVIFEKRDDAWLAHVPALNGITTEGDSLEHVKEMAREATVGYIECLRADNLPVPTEEDGSEPIVEKMTVAA